MRPSGGRCHEASPPPRTLRPRTRPGGLRGHAHCDRQNWTPGQGAASSCTAHPTHTLTPKHTLTPDPHPTHTLTPETPNPHTHPQPTHSPHKQHTQPKHTRPRNTHRTTTLAPSTTHTHARARAGKPRPWVCPRGGPTEAELREAAAAYKAFPGDRGKDSGRNLKGEERPYYATMCRPCQTRGLEVKKRQQAHLCPLASS